MTANMIKGKGFRGALRYNLEKVEKGVAEVLSHSFVEVSEKTIMKEIQMVRMLRPNLQKYFYHTSINFPPSENLPNERMREIASEYIKAAGFDQHQFIMFRHRDVDHPHLHILVNRIGFDGKVVSDSNDFARTEKILRELEHKYNLTQVISSKQAVKRAVTKDELEMMKRTNEPSSKVHIQKSVIDILSAKPRISCSEFIKGLEGKGIQVRFNVAKTGYVSGVSYSYKDMIITGSKLGNDFKWTTLKNKLDYLQERHLFVIQESNTQKKIEKVDAISRFTSYEKNNTSKATKVFDLGTSLFGESLRDIFRATEIGDMNPEISLKLRPSKKKPRRGIKR